MSETVQRRIKATELNTKFKYEITKRPGGEKLLQCFQCGTCTAGCPISRFNDVYRPKQIIRMIQLGLKERVLNKDSGLIWLCSYCYLCEERCPKDVKFPEVITILRNIAVEAGNIHPSLAKLVALVAEQGRIYDVDDFINMRRKRLGLPPLSTDKSEWSEFTQFLRLKK